MRRIRNAFKALGIAAGLAAVFTLASCGSEPVPLRIISGSENKLLEPILQEFGARENIAIEVVYQGSVDIMLELAKGKDLPYDAVWPANSIWISLGDTKKVVRHVESIMRSPVVFGVKKSVAERLGWANNPNVTIADVLKVTEAGQLRFAMTSATQSNSGATGYLGFLHAMAGNPEVLTRDHLESQEVQAQVRRLLRTVHRSSGSSGWLKDLYLEHPAQFDAMVNYEAMIIEANQAGGAEPLCAVYPRDGLTFADSPLGYVDKGDRAKEEAFKKLQAYLLSDEVQERIKAQGRRTGKIGSTIANADKTVFNPDWCIDTQRTIAAITLPDEPVIRRALTLYQTALRKPSFTVFLLDVSGSMKGDGISQLKSAMGVLLDPARSGEYLLQAGQDDITAVIPFNSRPEQPIVIQGGEAGTLASLNSKVQALEPGGGTNIYAAAVAALDLMEEKGIEGRLPAIILMTDGKSEEKAYLLDRKRKNSAIAQDIPIFSITFGQADPAQLKEVAKVTTARVFSGQKDLLQAFREAKGYN